LGKKTVAVSSRQRWGTRKTMEAPTVKIWERPGGKWLGREIHSTVFSETNNGPGPGICTTGPAREMPPFPKSNEPWGDKRQFFNKSEKPRPKKNRKRGPGVGRVVFSVPKPPNQSYAEVLPDRIGGRPRAGEMLDDKRRPGFLVCGRATAWGASLADPLNGSLLIS